MRIRFALSAVFVIHSAMIAARAQSPAPSNSSAGEGRNVLVLRGGTLIDGNGGDPVQNAVVVISGDRIQGVGREGEVAIPAEAEVLDTKGKTILPGLIDAHVHLRNYHAPLYLYWG